MADLCGECGTDHEGYPPDTLGARMRCLRSQADALGAGHLVDQMDAFADESQRRRDAALRANRADLVWRALVEGMKGRRRG